MGLLDWILGERYGWKLQELDDTSGLSVPYFQQIINWQVRQGYVKTVVTQQVIDKKFLRKVSLYYNQHIAYSYELNDFWPDSNAARASKKGDCDDQAIAKYGYLIESGADINKTFLVVVHDNSNLMNHMVCAYYEDPDNPWILDNGFMGQAFFKSNKSRNIVPLVAFNLNDIKVF